MSHIDTQYFEIEIMMDYFERAIFVFVLLALF